MTMRYPDVIFKLIEDQGCPMYHLGDEFTLSGTALMMPHEKPVCLILVKDMTGRFAKGKTPKSKEAFFCSGCTGRIRLSYRTETDDIRGDKPKSGPELAVIAGLLGRFEIFQSLGKNEVKHLVSMLRMRKYYENEIILRKGETGRNLYIIASGRVEVLGDNDVSIAFLGTGEVFGEMSLLSGEPVAATIRVMEPSRILYISGRDFRSVLLKYPSLQLYFTRLLARRLVNTNVARAEEFASGMIGRLSEMSPSELFQTLNNNMKSGVLVLDLAKCSARAVFREGNLVRAQYGRLSGTDAFYEILRENQGRFRFLPGLTEEDLQAEPLGDFMGLLMEGTRKIDEDQ